MVAIVWRQKLDRFTRIETLVAPFDAIERPEARFIDLPQLPLDRATLFMSHEGRKFADVEKTIERAGSRLCHEGLAGDIPIPRLASLQRAVDEQEHWAGARSIRGQVDPAIAHQEFHVFPDVFFGGRVSQEVRRMVGAHDLGAAVLEDSTAELAD